MEERRCVRTPQVRAVFPLRVTSPSAAPRLADTSVEMTLRHGADPTLYGLPKASTPGPPFDNAIDPRQPLPGGMSRSSHRYEVGPGATSAARTLPRAVSPKRVASPPAAPRLADTPVEMTLRCGRHPNPLRIAHLEYPGSPIRLSYQGPTTLAWRHCPDLSSVGRRTRGGSPGRLTGINEP